MTRVGHFRLGLFLVVCAALGAVAFIWTGAAHVFERTRTYAAYFREPLTGLAPGAPVEYLGVAVGRVDSVALAPGDRLVQVRVDLRSSFRLDPSMALSLAQAGITGSPFVALQETPPGERVELPHPPTRLPVLPVRAGGGGGLQGIERKLASLDVQGLVNAWEAVARDLDATLTRGGVAQVVENARAASAGVRRIAGAGPGGQPSQLEAIVLELQATTRSLRAATASIAGQVQGVPPGTAAEVAERVARTTALGEKTLRTLDANVGASLTLLREDLAQMRQAVIETQALARSLRNSPGRVLERGGGGDPFKR